MIKNMAGLFYKRKFIKTNDILIFIITTKTKRGFTKSKSSFKIFKHKL